MAKHQTVPSPQETTVFSSDQPFVEGMPVFDAGGEKIGHVADQKVEGNSLVVQKGWLFPEDFYVPLSAVERNGAEGVFLRLSKGEIQAQNEHITANDASDGSRVETINTEPTIATSRVEEGMGDLRVPMREEELIVGKQQQEIGRVRLHKDVVAEQRTVAEPLTREEVRIERMPVQGEYGEIGADVFTEKNIEIPVMGEELIIGKRVVVTEEIRLHKESVTEQRRIVETVRKERVTVEGLDELTQIDTQTMDDTREEA